MSWFGCSFSLNTFMLESDSSCSSSIFYRTSFGSSLLGGETEDSWPFFFFFFFFFFFLETV